MSHVVITGAQGGNGFTQGAVAPNRREINALIKDQEQFSLYIQALIAMQEKRQSDPLSHFGIAGIHGLPHTRWEGSGGTEPVEGAETKGYCTHGTVLFPTWHRPYVALFEQVLQQHAVEIAKGYQDQARWSLAAENLRAPYWDWATSLLPPPEVISLEYLDIIKPEGKKSVPNPLLRYKFKPVDPSFKSLKTDDGISFKDLQTTIRNPKAFLLSLLQSERLQSQITTDTYTLLTRVKTWPEFSNHTSGPGLPQTSASSLEAIHDTIHGTIGGHMGDTAVAGFDPIFFLHHCNVDRIFALWAARNPDVSVSKGPSLLGTFTISGGSDADRLDANTDLTPFWNSQTTYWNSSRIKATETLQYSYPEFNNVDLSNRDAVKNAIDIYIQKQYGRGREFFSHLQVPAGGVTPQAPNVINDWSTRINVKKYELSGSFTVLIFIGEVPEDPSQWCTSPSFVGSHYAFVNGVAAQCDNCRSQAQADLVIEGYVHLTSTLAGKPDITSYEPGEVIPYLKDNLNWRIQAADQTVIEPAKLPSLEVTVMSTPLTEAPGAIFPVSGELQYHPEATYGRPGGARQAQA